MSFLPNFASKSKGEQRGINERLQDTRLVERLRGISKKGDVDGSLAAAGVTGVCRGGMFTDSFFLWLFICGLAALQCGPYHHNRHGGKETMKERTRRTVDARDKGVHVDGLTLVQSVSQFVFHFLCPSPLNFNTNLQELKSGPHCIMSFT